METELPDTAEAMEAKETSRKLPLGWVLLFWGLIAWGIYYLYAYSPWSTGWTQEGELTDAKAAVSTGVNIGHTIAYTAIPALVVIVLALAASRGKRGRA